MAEQVIRLRRIRSLNDFITSGRTVPFRRSFGVRIRTYPNSSGAGGAHNDTMISNVSLTGSRFTVPLPSVSSGELSVSIHILGGLTGQQLLIQATRFEIGPNDANSLDGRELEMLYVSDWANALIELRNDMANTVHPDVILYNALQNLTISRYDQAFWEARVAELPLFLEEADDLGWGNVDGELKDKVTSARVEVALSSRLLARTRLLKSNGNEYGIADTWMQLVPPPSPTAGTRLQMSSFAAERRAPNRMKSARRARYRAQAVAAVGQISSGLDDPRQEFWDHWSAIRPALLRAGQHRIGYQTIGYLRRSTSVARPFDVGAAAGGDTIPAYRPVYCGGFSRSATPSTEFRRS